MFTIRWLASMAFAAGVLTAGELMPPAQQNALVARYCAVCHMDAAPAGGLSLQHFDAAKAAPSLVAMMLSKLKNGAMGASGIPRPDDATVDRLRAAFAERVQTAAQWSVERDAQGVTASILREVKLKAGEARAYRFAMSCTAAGERFAQVAWSPSPQQGVLAVTVDGKRPLRYEVQKRDTLADGREFETGFAAVVVSNGLPWPESSLVVSELFPGESVSFPFAELPADARRELGACFGR